MSLQDALAGVPIDEDVKALLSGGEAADAEGGEEENPLLAEARRDPRMAALLDRAEADEVAKEAAEQAEAQAQTTAEPQTQIADPTAALRAELEALKQSMRVNEEAERQIKAMQAELAQAKQEAEALRQAAERWQKHEQQKALELTPEEEMALGGPEAVRVLQEKVLARVLAEKAPMPKPDDVAALVQSRVEEMFAKRAAEERKTEFYRAVQTDVPDWNALVKDKQFQAWVSADGGWRELPLRQIFGALQSGQLSDFSPQQAAAQVRAIVRAYKDETQQAKQPQAQTKRQTAPAAIPGGSASMTPQPGDMADETALTRELLMAARRNDLSAIKKAVQRAAKPLTH